MKEPKEISNNKNAQQLDVYNVAYPPRQHVKKDIAEGLYQVLSLYESGIIQDIDKCKKDEICINNDIKCFSSCDNRREWKKQHIKNVEKDICKTVNHELPIQRSGLLRLRRERGWYVHWMQHGNNKRSEEAELYHEIRDVNDRIEIYTEPTAINKTWESNSQWRPALPKGYKQQQLKIVSNQLEKSWTIRRGQLMLKLDLLKKNIKCLEREIDEISSLKKKAYKCSYKHGDQQNEVKSSYTEYQSFIKYVKELARRGDTDELIQVCHRQLFEGCSKF